MMDIVRYVIAYIIIVFIPFIYVLWPLIHPFANFWRKIKPWQTYGIFFTLLGVTILTLTPFVELLTGTDYGFNPFLTIAGVFFWVISFVIWNKRRKYLTVKILLGYPEVSKKAYPGKLLTEGIYSKIRHPRYLELMFGAIGNALIVNMLGVYIIVTLLIPALYLTVLLEEKELIQRFGNAYVEYSKSVPRFFPMKMKLSK
jgi:protein-S-isoprenylcysteine O-methyltransferase Ste14